MDLTIWGAYVLLGILKPIREVSIQGMLISVQWITMINYFNVNRSTAHSLPITQNWRRAVSKLMTYKAVPNMSDQPKAIPEVILVL